MVLPLVTGSLRWSSLLDPGMAVLLIPGDVGAALARGVGAGIRRGESRLPGVEGLIADLNEPRLMQRLRAITDPPEIAPTAPPEIRGSEPAPSD
jgi:hypothetical protein